jgi:sarcosine oxidase delta subunit
MAFPSTYNFSYYRGDTAQFVIRPKNASDGSSYDLTGYDAIFTIANVRGTAGVQYSDTEGITAVVNATTDIVTCTITPAGGRLLSPGSYVYDVEIDNGTQIQTLLTGTVTVTDDITGAN